MDKLFITFGCEILQIVPGRVSTEVDARLTFDTEATLAKARKLIGHLRECWNRPRADPDQDRQHLGRHPGGRTLESEGIHCNLTLLFSFAQAVACAEAGVTLISPFVGRIYDWYCKEQRGQGIPADEDPGVRPSREFTTTSRNSITRRRSWAHSFRKADQIVRLAGCDLLTISPDLLEQLEKTEGSVSRRLSVETAKASDAQKIHLDEKTFRWMHNEDAMATEKLAEGIRKFYADARKLEQYAQARVAQKIAS